MFIPRHPVVENQFCSYASQTASTTAGVGGVVCYAGAVLWMVADATDEHTLNPNEESLVKAFGLHTVDEAKVPFGFAMQKVKMGYHQVHPTGFVMPGDLGSSDVIAQPLYSGSDIVGTKPAPLAVAHNGIWDTVHYTVKNSGGTVGAAYPYTWTPSTVTDGDQMKPGQALFVAGNLGGRVTNYNTIAANDTDGAGGFCETTSATTIAKVVKGASYTKCEANMKNTTLYPIRIKLLI